jgi:hypothetical protein
MPSRRLKRQWKLSDQAPPRPEYAWKFRHPGESDESLREESEQALAVAQNV